MTELDGQEPTWRAETLVGEAVDAEHHLPGATALGPPRAGPDLAVVLLDPPPRVHRKPARTSPVNPSINGVWN